MDVWFDNLPALQVVLPLLGSVMCVVFSSVALARALAFSIAAACTAISVALVRAVVLDPISYEMGGWAPPLGIEYRVDVLNAFVLLVVSSIATVVLASGATFDVATRRLNLFYAAFLVTFAGLLGITITGDLFNVFVFLEISSLGSYTLIALGRDRRALMAAFSYLILGTIGGTLILFGIGLVYQMTGTLNMADVIARLPAAADTRVIRTAFACLCVGTAIKLAVFPLHQWLPNAYTWAPSAVGAFLAATATKVSFYVFLRLTYTLFGAAFVFGVLGLREVIVALALVAMLAGSAAAIYQTDLKRLLAYSSVSQIGLLLLGLGLGNEDGLTGAIVHVFNHAWTKGGLFLAVAGLVANAGGTSVAGLAGLGRKMPWTSGAIVIGGLGLIGVPGTAGFVSKWYLVLGALERGWVGVAFAVLAISLLSAVYVWRIVEIAYFKERDAALEEPREVGWPLRLSTWTLIGGTVVFGFWTPWTAGVAGIAARTLAGV